MRQHQSSVAILNSRVHTDPANYCNLSHIFQARKDLESGLGPGNSRRVMEMSIAGATDFLMLSMKDFQTVKNFGLTSGI